MTSQQHCVPETFSNVSRGIVDFIGFIMILTTIPALYKTIEQLRKKSQSPNEKSYHALFWFGLSFQIVTILTIIDLIIASIFYCPYTLHKKFSVLFNIAQGTYTILLAAHYYILLLILFIRLYFAFKGSTFALKKCTVRFYTFCYILQPITFISGSFLYLMDNEEFGLFLVAITAILILCIIISIVILYVNRLIMVYRLSDGDEHYMGIATKTTILTVICLTVTMIGYTPFILINYLNGHSYWIYEICLLIDIYANWICVVGGYPMFSTYYERLCGALDLKCRNCCRYILGIDNEINVAKEIQMSQAPSGSPASMSPTSADSTIQIIID